MSDLQKVVFFGAGNMAEALIKGIVASQIIPAKGVFAWDIRPERRQELAQRYGISAPDSQSQLSAADVLVVAVKPQVLPHVAKELAGLVGANTLVVSIVAGVTLASLSALFPKGTAIVRTMPNTPALVQAGATAISPAEHVPVAQLDVVRGLFGSVGEVVELPEHLIDAATAVAGTGPAYLMLVMESLADGGVRLGLPRDIALRLAAQTVLGAGKLLLESGQHPGQLKDMVTSPAGVTIEGVASLEESGVRAAFIKAVKAAGDRASALGKTKD